MTYYNNYEIDCCAHCSDLTERQQNLLDASIWLVDNRSSIRLTAKNFEISKSWLHRVIHSELREISYELYKCVTKQLKINQLHRCSGRFN